MFCMFKSVVNAWHTLRGYIFFYLCNSALRINFLVSASAFRCHTFHPIQSDLDVKRTKKQGKEAP